METNETKCILAPKCSLAGSALKCTDLCPAYILMHSASGRHTNAGLPADYALADVETATPRAEQAEVFRVVDRYVETFSESDRIKSLYLYSAAPGTGKTTTAAAILNAYLRASFIKSARDGAKLPTLPAYFLDVNKLQTLYNEFNRKNIPIDVAELSARKYYKSLDNSKSASFVVFDDIGVRTSTEGFRGDLHGVINGRLVDQKPMVFTSNVTVNELEIIFDSRLSDRVRDMCLTISFSGSSKRGMR